MGGLGGNARRAGVTGSHALSPLTFVPYHLKSRPLSGTTAEPSQMSLYFVFFVLFCFFAAIDRIIRRPHAMSQLHHGMGSLRAKDRRTTQTTGKRTHHSTDIPRRTETVNLQRPAHVCREAAKCVLSRLFVSFHLFVSFVHEVASCT